MESMGNFNILPADILSDILTCLPAESVQDQCKLVSKTWKNLIDHPSFSKMHTNRLMKHSTDSGKLGFMALAKNRQLYYFEYIENHERPIDRIGRIKITSLFMFNDLFKFNAFIGSFNGLICLRGRKERFCICNPMTKEYVIIPAPKLDFVRFKDRWFGFGYLASTNEYKIVLMYKVPKSVEVMVYTLGSGHGWRNIGIFDLEYNYVYSGHGTFANGALHWMHGLNRRILVFDLADEKFREPLTTPPLPKLLPCCWPKSRVSVLGGLLCCAFYIYFGSAANPFRSDIWLYKKKNDNMKEQDEHQSLGWSKELTSGYSTPLALTKSGGVLGYIYSYFGEGHGSSYFDIHDPKTSHSKVLQTAADVKEQFGEIFPHKNTLVSLKEIGEQGTKIVQSVKTKKRKRSD